MDRDKLIEQALIDSFDFWLQQHPLTIESAIESGVKAAVLEWLALNKGAVLQQMVKED